MALGIEVGLGAGHIVLDEDTASPMERGTADPIVSQFTDCPYNPRPMFIIIVIIIIIFFDPGTSFPRYGILSKCEMSGMATMELSLIHI